MKAEHVYVHLIKRKKKKLSQLDGKVLFFFLSLTLYEKGTNSLKKKKKQASRFHVVHYADYVTETRTSNTAMR